MIVQTRYNARTHRRPYHKSHRRIKDQGVAEALFSECYKAHEAKEEEYVQQEETVEACSCFSDASGRSTSLTIFV